jgi:hypothetical protein
LELKKILPILNRCDIFNTSNKSIHGHPEKLYTPENIRRQSIAVYYYTKNTNNQYDFEVASKRLFKLATQAIDYFKLK